LFKRKVITRSGARTRGYFPSVKSNRQIPWESPLERDALLVAEFNPRVLRMQEHQRRIAIDSTGDPFVAFPDFIFDFEDEAPLTVEVKSDLDFRDPETQARLAQVANHLSRLGERYWVWTESDIRRSPRLELLEELLTFRRPGADVYLRERPGVAEVLRWSGSFSLIAASKRVQSRSLILQLIANDLLLADLDRPFVDSTILIVNEGLPHAHVSH